MTSSPSPLLVVLGATGHQGSSVLRHFATHPSSPFRLRGLTRNPSSPSSQSLSALGIEMVSADLASPSSLAAALTGATHLFATTDSNQLMFDAARNPDISESPPEYATRIERGYGRNLARAAAQVPELQRVVWSGLASPARWSGGKYNRVAMFDAKEDIEGYLTGEVGLDGKVSVLMLGFYAENARRVPDIYAPKQSDGVYELALPMAGNVPVPIADVESDAGRWVEALFRAPAGVKLVGASEYLTWEQWLDMWGVRNGVPTRYRELPPGESPTDIDGVKEAIVEEFRFIEEFGFAGGNPEALQIDDLRRQGVLIETSLIADHIRRADWSSIL